MANDVVDRDEGLGEAAALVGKAIRASAEAEMRSASES